MRMIARTNSSQRPARSRSLCRSFTLTELLVAMGIIVIIAGVTAVGVQRIARQARVANATNTVIASLDTARAIAIRDNRITMVVFRPRQDGNAVFVEMVIAQQAIFGGEIFQPGGGTSSLTERFVPRTDVAVRRLPNGIKVAAPLVGDFGGPSELDQQWITQSHWPSMDPDTGAGEQPGQLIAVMYNTDGTVITRNAAVDGNFIFVDFNNNGLMDIGGTGYSLLGSDFPVWSGSFGGAESFNHLREADESPISFTPFIAVYDDASARDAGDPSTWGAVGNQQDLGPGDGYYDDLVGPLPENPDEPGAPLTYISRNADRIHFNRYTGVVLR